MTPVSILDLAPITAGSDAGQALRNSRDLAEHAERWGYHRYWLAEHHNMPGVASAATSVAICFVAERTTRLRVGAGGIMLPNHAPLVVAEQFGTLASLFPGRVDLGLGRAPGTDRVTMRALRRRMDARADSFPEDVRELLRYFGSPAPGDLVRAVPGAGLGVPVWLLGSSLYSAELAASLGLPFAFAAHFAPDLLFDALELYRSKFRPSTELGRPHAMACTHVFAADTDAEAWRLFTSLAQAYVALRAGNPIPLPPPLEGAAGAVQEEVTGAAGAGLFRHAVVGSKETVRRGVSEFVRETAVDELMVTAMIYDHGARLRSFEIVADALKIEPPS